MPYRALIFTLQLWCHETKLCQFHQSSLFHLNDIDDGVGEVPDESPRDLGVDEAVAHDEDVEQRLAQRSSILHLPAGSVILPVKERVKLGHPTLVNTDLLLLIVPELPPHVLRPCDQLPLPVPVHQRPELLDKVLQPLGAALVERVHKLSGLLEVGQLVKVTLILGLCGGDDAIEDGPGVKLNLLDHDDQCPVSSHDRGPTPSAGAVRDLEKFPVTRH